MSPEPGDVPPGYADPWRITHVGRRVKWSEDSRRCRACGSRIPLRERHVHVRIQKDPHRPWQAVPGEDLVLCNDACLDDWGAGSDSDADSA